MSRVTRQIILAFAVLAFSSIILGTAIVSKAQDPKTQKLSLGSMETRELRIVDSDGKPEIVIHGSGPGEGPALTFYTKEGVARLILSLNPKGTAAILLGDPRSKQNVQVVLLANGTAGLIMESGGGAAHVVVPTDKQPNIQLYGAENDRIFQAVR